MAEIIIDHTKDIKIGGVFTANTGDRVIAVASQIYDENLKLNQEEINKKIGTVSGSIYYLESGALPSKPSIGTENQIHLVLKTTGSTNSDSYDEYIWIGTKSSWEFVGSINASLDAGVNSIEIQSTSDKAELQINKGTSTSSAVAIPMASESKAGMITASQYADFVRGTTNIKGIEWDGTGNIITGSESSKTTGNTIKVAYSDTVKLERTASGYLKIYVPKLDDESEDTDYGVLSGADYKKLKSITYIESSIIENYFK